MGGRWVLPSHLRRPHLLAGGLDSWYAHGCIAAPQLPKGLHSKHFENICSKQKKTPNFQALGCALRLLNMGPCLGVRLSIVALSLACSGVILLIISVAMRIISGFIILLGCAAPAAPGPQQGLCTTAKGATKSKSGRQSLASAGLLLY